MKIVNAKKAENDVVAEVLKPNGICSKLIPTTKKQKK